MNNNSFQDIYYDTTNIDNPSCSFLALATEIDMYIYTADVSSDDYFDKLIELDNKCTKFDFWNKFTSEISILRERLFLVCCLVEYILNTPKHTINIEKLTNQIFFYPTEKMMFIKSLMDGSLSLLKHEYLERDKILTEIKITKKTKEYFLSEYNDYFIWEMNKNLQNDSKNSEKSDLINNSNINKTFVSKINYRQKVYNTYDVSVLNTSIPINEIIEMIGNAIDNANEYPKGTRGIKILCSGLPGTGKSEFAKYVYTHFQDKFNGILFISPSTVLSSYIGETEINISNYFKKAETESKILVIDEIDSFLRSKTSSQNNWEISLVNQLLIELENSDALIIATTNYKDMLEKAALRRFNLTIEFNSLNSTGIRRCLQSYFPKILFTREQMNLLNSCKTLTPSDFATLNHNLRFTPKEKVISEYIIKQLVYLQKDKDKNKIVGFNML